jgi:hypothetical protein
MDAAFYEDLATTAVELLADFGEPCSLVRPASEDGGDYDPETSEITGGNPEITFTANGVEAQYRLADVDGTLITMADRRIYLDPALGTTPKRGDTLVLANGARLAVIESRPVRPAGILLLHDVQCRGNS